MKKLEAFQTLGIETPDQGFDYLISTMRPSLKLWEYFVKWDKVFANTRSLEVHLNIWNYLLGKTDFDSEFRALLAEHPQIVKAIPTMIVRDGAKSSLFSIIENISDLGATDLEFDFSKPADSEEKRELALTFVKSSGLIRLFHKDGVKNLVDYVLGVEAGLDSNGRKNRSGKSMETVVGAYLESFALENELELIDQATAPKIKAKWGFVVPVDKSTRRFDFAISNGKALVLVEVNFYGGGGSKLKATAGEYVGLHEMLTDAGHTFVWVTDGNGWKTTLKPLRAAFEKVDYIWNLKMLNQNALTEFFK